MKHCVKSILPLAACMLLACCTAVEESTAETVSAGREIYLDLAESEKERAGLAPEREGEPCEAVIPPKEADTAEKMLESMSLEEKIGQVILARYPDAPAEQSEKYQFGGYTLYAKDFENETPESLGEKLSVVRAASVIPPFIAADEEGGDVVRISGYRAFAEKPLPSLASAAAEGKVREFAEETADILNRAGVNLNLAPVADVAESERDYIYKRTCGLGYEETGAVIAELAENLNRRGIMCCLKHFPGYGSNADTHTGVAVDRRSDDEFAGGAFIPFRAGIDAGAPMVMVNHNIAAAYNGDMPASLAPEVHSVLRELGFRGIIVTDDLGMDAVSAYTDSPYASAFLAGNDLLCASDGAACYEALSEALKNGQIAEERLDESVYRIISAKVEYGIAEG